MSAAVDGGKGALLVFAAALLQVSTFNSLDVLGGAPDVLLVVLVCLALLRGAVFGACAGFFAGLLVDTATLETLGLTSLLLTLTGYWAGRYGETTARGRTQAPIIAVAAATPLYALAALGLHAVLGDDVSARVLLETLAPTLVLNVLLAAPVNALCRRILTTPQRVGEPDVRLLT